MIPCRMEGLIAAAVTPLRSDGRLNLDQVAPIVDRLIEDGVAGFYVCGSTGEGMSLSDDERCAVAEAYIKAARGRAKIMIQVGHNSLASAVRLASHAQDCGADALSATCPSYFPLQGLDALIASMAQVAAGAPSLPFYYYHIPMLTGARFDMVDFLAQADEHIPSLAGLKYTMPTLHEYQLCQEFSGGKFDILWGVDEMLLAAVATGANGAVGSTYNIAAGAYLEIIRAVSEGRLTDARLWQSRVANLVRILASFPFHAALRETMRLLGMECGPCRLPLRMLTPTETENLRRSLDEIGFSSWNEGFGSAAHRRTDAASASQLAPPSATPHLSARKERV
ncbi:MAG TPA: dihydrodipicolinate synthase family protein [Lacipirellula sp.]